jgi:Mlc titration factor MtfA (ptsG expression regulator)
MSGFEWFVLGVPAAILTGLFYAALLRYMRFLRRKRLLGLSLKPYQLKILDDNVPLYRKLPEDLKQQLHGLIHVFLAEKRFVGCNGQEITEIVRIATAAQACLLLLNRKTSYYGRLKTIYVYPDTYVADSVESDGDVMVEEKSIRLGESWQHGPVVLTWNSIAHSAHTIDDGCNVVLHEFAHQLDQEDGVSDGPPILEDESSYQAWRQVLGEHFERLKHHRRPFVIDSYAFENPAEFFAVATEVFYEKPEELHTIAPELYDKLKMYYNIDPLNWISP